MNKVEKIRKEIERLKQQFMSQADDFHSLGMEEKENYCAILASNMAALIRYIDSLEEEPVSNDLEKEIQRYYNEMDGDCRYMQTARHFARWQKQQVVAKACDWLADNYSKYIITNGLATIFSATIDFDTIRMIKAFKKAMEG